MSQKDFKDRLSRMGMSTAVPVRRVGNDHPRQHRSRWKIWALLVCFAVGAYAFLPSSDPEPTLTEVFTGESAPAFAGELQTRSFNGYGFALDIPTDWRVRTRAEKDSVGGSFAEFIEGIDVESYTQDTATSDKLMFAIMTARTTDTEPTQSVKALQGLMNSGMQVMRFVADVSATVVVPPTRVDAVGLPSAEAVSHTKRPAGDFNSLYRSYLIGADLVMILVIWDDMTIHPSAFAPILNSLREI